MEKTLKWKIEIDTAQAEAAVKRVDEGLSKEYAAINAKAAIIEKLGKQYAVLSAAQRMVMASQAVDSESKTRKESAALALKLSILNRVAEAQKRMTTVQGLKEPDYEKALAGIAEMGNLAFGQMDEHVAQWKQFQAQQRLAEKEKERAEKEADKRFRERTAQEKRAASEQKRGSETIAKNLPLAAAPLFQPTSFWANAIAVNRIQAMLQTPQGSAMLNKTGMSAAGFTGAAVAAMVALGLALKGLKEIVSKAIDAINFSTKTYFKSAQSGLGLRTETNRALLAQIMGVDEKEIFQFGAVMAYIRPKIKDATNTLAASAVPLTKLKIDFEILKVKMLALGSGATAAALPLLDGFIDGISRFVDALSKMDVIQGALSLLIKVFQVLQFNLQNIAFGFQLVASGLNVLMATVNDFIYFLAKINPAVKLITIFTGVGTSIMTPDALKKFAADAKNAAVTQFGLAKDILGIGDPKKKSGAGFGFSEPQSFAKQMPVSAWEKMGLVIGGGAKNFAAETAKNTKKSADALDKILSAVVAGNVGTPIFSTAQNHP